MKILFLSHYFPPEVNAPASRTFEHCRAWVRQGHHVTVVTCVPNHPRGRAFPGYRNRLFEREVMEGVNVIRIWTLLSANEGFLLRTLNYLSYMVMAILLSPRFGRADVVVSTSPQFFNGLAGYFVSLLKRCRWVLEIRDLWPESIVAVGAITNKRIIRILEWIERFAYLRADAIVVVTQAFSKLIGKKIGSEDKIHVVRNGANLSLFSPTATACCVPVPEIERLHGKTIVSYVGTHGMAHGLDRILEVAERLSTRPDIHFLFVGDGAERNNLQQMAEQRGLINCTFTGQLPKNQMPYVWEKSHISLVVLRKSKTFESVIPSKIFECMAMAKPMILGVEGEAALLVKQANAGVCVEPENIEEIYKAVSFLADQSKVREAMGISGSQFVREQCDREKLAMKMLMAIHSAVLNDVVVKQEEIQR